MLSSSRVAFASSKPTTTRHDDVDDEVAAFDERSVDDAVGVGIWMFSYGANMGADALRARVRRCRLISA